ncbi:MAG TPA: patatin-like phospholipase family protein [Candidatus Cloacimonadota bacterium]|nr:patatin-like phospholipase family protein [Candidatus Cloacimonadota bacterium]
MKRISFAFFIIFAFSVLSAQEKIGLALSGGGVRGLAHIGVLKVIDEMNIPIDYIAGTSSGAIIGGLYAIGYSAEEIEQIFLEEISLDLFSDQIERRDFDIGNKRWKPYANFTFEAMNNLTPKLPQALVSGNKFINVLLSRTYEYNHIRNFDLLPIPFRCVATNILTGEEKVFSSGSLPEVIRASLSFPSVFQPFRIDGQMYIDGGIVSNLPAEVVRNMGADIVIGVNVSSGLRTEDRLSTLIDVLDQTVNFSITENVENSRKKCDILIEPDLSGLSILDFKKKKEMIASGEAAARQYFQKNPFSYQPGRALNKAETLPDKISFSRIRVVGNIYLSNAKTRETVGLLTNQKYTKAEIMAAFREAYNSDLFSFIYPVIDQIDDHYILTIKLREKNRITYGLDVSYNQEKEINLGVTLTMNNVVQKNSKMLVNGQIGDKQEFNVDYVKNFGKHMGVYFRIFPYLKEFILHSYDEDHVKTNSVRSLEFGSTFGVGFYARKAIVLEFYGYNYYSKLYQNIAEFTEQEINSTGFGVKMLHENLDDYIFPMNGLEFFCKYSQANKEFYSDFDNRTFFSRFRLLIPFAKQVSLKYKFEYGSHFEKQINDFTPFYIGGIDDFLGLRTNEKVAPIYKVNTFSIRTNFIKNFFIDWQMNFLNLGDVDTWEADKFSHKGCGLILGYKSLLGPIRMAASFDDDYHTYYYFSFGLELDQFEFSRR